MPTSSFSLSLYLTAEPHIILHCLLYFYSLFESGRQTQRCILHILLIPDIAIDIYIQWRRKGERSRGRGNAAERIYLFRDDFLCHTARMEWDGMDGWVGWSETTTRTPGNENMDIGRMIHTYSWTWMVFAVGKKKRTRVYWRGSGKYMTCFIYKTEEGEQRERGREHQKLE